MGKAEKSKETGRALWGRGKSALRSLPQVLWNLTLISVGSTVCAVGVNGILVPHKFLSG